MAEITMPKLSDTMEEGTLVRWLKQQGDQINEGDPIAEIQTDKANVEMEAYEPGILDKILVAEGQTVPVGQAIAELKSLETAAAGGPPQAASPEGQPEIPVTKEPTPYTTEQVPLVTAPPPPEAATPAPKVEEKAPSLPPVEERVKASPLARTVAEERGVDLTQVHGTGPDGRITEADIEAYLSQAQAAPPKKEETETLTPGPSPLEGRGEAIEAPAPPKPKVHPTTGVPYEEQELNRMRKTIAERMTQSKQTTPHFYITMDVDMDWSSRVREELNADQSQPKVSFTDLIIKACALALTKFPRANSAYTEGKLHIYKEINIGLAVALEDGLVAPVIHNADKMTLRQVAAESKELAQHARENKLQSSEYTGGTFTISNLGMYGVESFSSIINPPEAASLAVGMITEMPVVVNGQVTVSKRMKATLSADHRVLDGAVAAEFLREIKLRLESPIGLL